MSDDFFSVKKEGKRLYKDTITGLNSEWEALLRSYRLGDTRVLYLETFEAWLSMNCPKPLWTMERYSRIASKYPLRPNTKGFVGRDLFRLYLMLYELIMRDVGLIGRKEDESPEVEVFDMGE